jgi:ArsR family transcriptional regulator
MAMPGAINVPVASLERVMASLPREWEIVAYRQGPYCVLPFGAIEALSAWGFQARRLEDGFPEWKAAGRAVEAA